MEQKIRTIPGLPLEMAIREYRKLRYQMVHLLKTSKPPDDSAITIELSSMLWEVGKDLRRRIECYEYAPESDGEF